MDGVHLRHPVAAKNCQDTFTLYTNTKNTNTNTRNTNTAHIHTVYKAQLFTDIWIYSDFSLLFETIEATTLMYCLLESLVYTLMYCIHSSMFTQCVQC